MIANRLLIVSNRLPLIARLEDGRVRLTNASGGLATGLKSWHQRSNSVWIGWPGPTHLFTPSQHLDLQRALVERGVVGLSLSAQEVQYYYQGFSNHVLWPLFHYLVDRVPVDASGWDMYRQVNEKFARAVVETYRPGDTIWIHDYQLMLVAA